MSQPRTLSDLFAGIAQLLYALGKSLKQRREATGLTRAELAKQTGLTVATIHQIETGRIADLGAWAKLLAHSGIADLHEEARREGLVRTFRRNGHNGVGPH